MLETEQQRESARQWFDIEKQSGRWESTDGCDCYLCEFGRRVNDPASLAKLMAMEAKRLGLRIECEVEGERIVVRLDDGSATPIYCFRLMPSARKVLDQWIRLPDGDSERAELALRSAL